MKRSIKFLVITTIFIFMSVQTYGQKCKYDYQKKDEITGEETKGSTFDVKRGWKLGLNKNGNQYSIGMLVQFDGNLRDIITPENTIIFKLENGEIITVNANQNYVPTAQATQFGIVSMYNARYNITKDDLKKIASSSLIYIRIGIGLQTYDESIPSKKGKSFLDQANCILQ